MAGGQVAEVREGSGWAVGAAGVGAGEEETGSLAAEARAAGWAAAAEGGVGAAATAAPSDLRAIMAEHSVESQVARAGVRTMFKTKPS